MQKGPPWRVLTVTPKGVHDEGVHPLEAFVDASDDGLAVTLEFDESEAIRPALYVRRGGRLRDCCCRRTRCAAMTAQYVAEVDDALKPLLGS